jgi:hypothetical protein
MISASVIHVGVARQCAADGCVLQTDAGTHVGV